MSKLPDIGVSGAATLDVRLSPQKMLLHFRIYGIAATEREEAVVSTKRYHLLFIHSVMFRIIGMITPTGHGATSATAESIEVARQKAAKMRSEGFLVYITAPDGTVVSEP